MSHFCPESTQINYDCSQCPAHQDKTVKLWRTPCEWKANCELTCRECTETKECQKLEDSEGVRIGRSVPAIPYKTNDDENNEGDGFRPFTCDSLQENGYSQWADLPEK